MASSIQQEQINNPEIPYTGSIKGGLEDSKGIIVTGKVLPGADRFKVDLRCGSKSESNIALHFNPRYDDGPECIMTNTCTNSCWGQEERIQQALLPRGDTFNLQILVTQSSYKISVNGKHIKDYNHRIPYHMVDTIVINGMVEITSIVVQKPMSVPYNTTINGGLQSGKNIYIQGVVNPQAQSFFINLTHRDGIALCYNPRFNENVVVRNTKTQNDWGEEERDGGLPFQKGEPFQLVITCEQNRFTVLVNDEQVHTYDHRFTKLGEIDGVEVTGDLTLTPVIA